jgi:predicted patatin/cPLA2 family phospholipase
VPFLTPVARYRGRAYLDGGVSDSIPIEKSVADGNTFHVIVLTRNAGYRKEAAGYARLIRAMYRKYPRAAEAMLCRHEVYNRQLALCEQLEREGNAVIIRPQRPLEVTRTGSDIKKLLALYDEGRDEGREKLDAILKRYKP